MPSEIAADQLVSVQGRNPRPIDEVLRIIDQQILDLTRQTFGSEFSDFDDLISAHDVAINLPSTDIINDIHILNFKARADVYCVMGICQGIKMSGSADVKINIDQMAISVTNLYAENIEKAMILSGSIERLQPHRLLQSLATANMVLTIDGDPITMNPNAELYFYEGLAKNDVLEALFRVVNENHRIMLDGNLNKP